MLLMDQVAQARETMVLESRTGRREVPCSADRAQAVAACPLRYVVEPNAADRCRSLLTTDRGMLAAENDLIRMPAPELWVEWLECDGRRTGCLIEATEDGRAGSIEVFWEQEAGEPVRAQATLQFDFRSDTMAICEPRRAFGLIPGAHPLCRNFWFVLEEEWMSYFQEAAEAPARRAIGTVINTLIPSFEMLLAFSALFTSRPILLAERSDLSRLNRKRAGAGRKALLDHMKVKLDLSRNAFQSRRDIADATARRLSRLHFVRGHMVRRGPSIFWRRSHLRGDASSDMVRRTVNVSWTGDGPPGDLGPKRWLYHQEPLQRWTSPGLGAVP